MLYIFIHILLKGVLELFFCLKPWQNVDASQCKFKLCFVWPPTCIDFHRLCWLVSTLSELKFKCKSVEVLHQWSKEAQVWKSKLALTGRDLLLCLAKGLYCQYISIFTNLFFTIIVELEVIFLNIDEKEGNAWSLKLKRLRLLWLRI